MEVIAASYALPSTFMANGFHIRIEADYAVTFGTALLAMGCVYAEPHWTHAEVIERVTEAGASCLDMADGKT